MNIIRLLLRPPACTSLATRRECSYKHLFWQQVSPSLFNWHQFLLPPFLFVFVCLNKVLRHRRRGSLTTRKPHHYWCIYDYEGTFNQFDNTHAKNNINALTVLSINSHSKGGARPPLDLLNCTQKQRGTQNKMKEGPHSVEGTECSKLSSANGQASH